MPPPVIRNAALQIDQHQNVCNNNIMLVDDEEDILLNFKTWLVEASKDYNVETFVDSREALSRFREVGCSYYNLLITDIRMPKLNGVQLYQLVKGLDVHIKVLFISALDAAEEIVSILPGVGLRDIIQKPVDREHFVNKIKATFNQQYS